MCIICEMDARRNGGKNVSVILHLPEHVEVHTTIIVPSNQLPGWFESLYGSGSLQSTSVAVWAIPDFIDFYTRPLWSRE